MAGTQNPAYGRTVALKLNGVRLINLKSTDLSQSRATRDVTTKESDDNEESRGTIKSRSFSFAGIMPEEGPNAVAGPALQTAFESGSIGTWFMGDGLAGHPSWAGSGFLTALNFKAPHDGNVEFDGTVKTTGVVTFALT